MRNKIYRFRTAPCYFNERIRYAFRRALAPEIIIPLWVSTPAGTKFFLSSDPVDDHIVHEIILRPESLYPVIPEDVHGVVVDIGGHHGLYVSEALHRYQHRELIVIEPHPEWCRLIEMNTKANNGNGRTRIINACLANNNEAHLLFFDPDSSWGATINPISIRKTKAIDVYGATLREILGKKYPALIYCNAEGAEYTLVEQLRAMEVRPNVLVLMAHPEYGDVKALRNQVAEMKYDLLDMSSNSKRPIIHCIYRGTPK